jgi:hypothetical protein
VANELNRSIALELGGLAEVLGGRRLTVPAFQRSYAWGKEQVDALWGDLRAALVLDDPEYFLGTIVLTQAADERSVIDGQQRLATASLLLAAVRNAFADKGDGERADVLEGQYLAARDLRSAQVLSRLKLNEVDDPHFHQIIFERDYSLRADAPGSHKRLSAAMETLESHISGEVERAGRNWPDRLLAIVEALESSVRLIIVSVASDADAYLIFETLNDRGLPLNISDLLKNYLFGVAQGESAAVQSAWAEMDSAIQATADEETIKTFIRHSWMSGYGAVRERELYRHIRRRVHSPTQALETATFFAEAAPNYTALLDPLSMRWVELGIDHDVPYTLNRLGLEQFRPMALAALDVMEGAELVELLERLIAWLTRGLVVGGIGGGTLERYYADVAVALRNGSARTASQVLELLENVVPSDDEFRSAFSVRRVNKLRLTQYLVQACEQQEMGVARPSVVSIENDTAFAPLNVLPRKAPSGEWPQFDEQTLGPAAHRLGNVVIVPASMRDLPSEWEAKRNALAEIDRPLCQTASTFDAWDPDAIASMQLALADAALLTWPR